MEIKQLTNESFTVLVLMGGTSSERDVSLVSGQAVVDAISDTSLNVIPVILEDDALPDECLKADVVFPVLHGGFGENGGIQALLEQAGIPYVGSDAEASALIMDKQKSKDHLEQHGLPVPKGIIVNDDSIPYPKDIPLPAIVKPNFAGSTIGLSYIDSEEQWPEAIKKSQAVDSSSVVEEFVKGIETTVGVINGQALSPVEIVPPGEIYDYDAKYVYDKGKTEYLCPPQNLTDEIIDNLKKIAVASYTSLNARDMVRVDIIVKDNGECRILEANSLPGFTSTSLLPKAAQEAGISFKALCCHLILSAYERKYES